MDEHREHPAQEPPDDGANGALPKSAPEGAPAPAQDAKPPAKTPVERLYDKIPLTFRQVDILVKVLIALFAVVLIIGIATGSGIGGG